MSLTRLLIRDFRNIETADLALSPGFNFLVGANGSGKTSVLEAIYTLGHGRAFRSLQIGRVIRHEQEAFVLHGRLQGEERETAIGLTKDKQGDSKVRIDGTDGHKVAELAHLMPMQLITPEGFTLLNGGPKYRRALASGATIRCAYRLAATTFAPTLATLSSPPNWWMVASRIIAAFCRRTRTNIWKLAAICSSRRLLARRFSLTRNSAAYVFMSAKTS